MKKLILPFLFASALFAGNENLTSFNSAKKLLKDQVYPQNQNSIYCGCTYSKQEIIKDYDLEYAKAEENWKVYHWDSLEGFSFPTKEEFLAKPKKYKLVPNHESCGYVPKGSGKRAEGIEWEHVVPAWEFGHKTAAWQVGDPACVTKAREVRKCKRLENGGIECNSVIYPAKSYNGRGCANKVHQDFKKMQADMHNLYPAIGELNGYRSNYPIALIEGEEREFGECDAEIKDKQFEPAPFARGEIARTYLYMGDAYPDYLQFSDEMKKMLNDWSKSDKVDKWECERNKVIESLQGNANSFVQRQCDKLNLEQQEEQDKQKRFEGMYDE